MRVGYDASVIFSSVGGTKTYAVQILSSLLELKADWNFFLYVRNDDQRQELNAMWSASNVHVQVVPGSPNTLRVQARMPRFLSRDAIDVYHSLGYFLPLRWSGPEVVTIHDMNVYIHWREWARRGRKILNWADMAVQIPLAARRAARIITDSESSHSEIRRILHVDPPKILVVPLAPDPFFDGAPTEAEKLAARSLVAGAPYVLFVGIISAQKNLGMLVRAFARSGLAADGLKLVLAGSDREKEGAVLRRLAEATGVGGNLMLTGYVSRETLRALYHQAEAVVLPSHGEGFGLPLVEAMASGSPVLAARRQSLPEVVGEGGELFEPDNVDQLADLLRRVHGDATFRADLVRRGGLRRSDFSWERAAEATAGAYEDALRSSR